MILTFLMLSLCSQNSEPTGWLPFPDGIVAEIGEGPIWDERSSLLLWIDVNGHRLFLSDPDKGITKTIDLPASPGTVVPTDNDRLLVALTDGIYLLEPETQKLTLWTTPDDLTPSVRFNDGKCDAEGRFWVGTVDQINYADPIAALYRVEGREVSPMIGKVTISNGITWSLDNRTLYYIDTPTRKVIAFDFDLSTGGISNPRDVILIPEGWGDPDGCTLDEEGMLWVALWGGSAVTRWDPESGELLRKIDLPVRHVSAVAFGGTDLDTLFITTAKASWAKLDEPLGGRLFYGKPGVRGVPANRFKIPTTSNL